MEDSKIAFKANILTKNSIPFLKVICSKCAGSVNFKTPEKSRRSCLDCFGKGFYKRFINFFIIKDKNISLLI